LPGVSLSRLIGDHILISDRKAFSKEISSAYLNPEYGACARARGPIEFSQL